MTSDTPKDIQEIYESLKKLGWIVLSHHSLSQEDGPFARLLLVVGKDKELEK